MNRTRTDDRLQFLSDLVTTAVENFGYGWFQVDEYRWQNVASPYAVIRSRDLPGRTARVDVDTVARGIGVVRRAVLRVPDDRPKGKPELHNAATGKLLHMSEAMRRRILDASRDNDAGELDVVDALALVECALFGAVTFA